VCVSGISVVVARVDVRARVDNDCVTLIVKWKFKLVVRCRSRGTLFFGDKELVGVEAVEVPGDPAQILFTVRSCQP